MKQDEKHRIDMIVKIMHWILIIFAVCFLLMIIPAKCSAQTTNNNVIEPNYGLAITGAGMSICAIGTTMRTSAYRQYSSRYGYNYVSYENYNSTATLRLSTLAVGIVVTVGGILIQNRRKKKNS
jgi:hypothetical protein